MKFSFDRTLSGANNLADIRPISNSIEEILSIPDSSKISRNNGNEGVVRIHQISLIKPLLCAVWCDTQASSLMEVGKTSYSSPGVQQLILCFFLLR